MLPLRCSESSPQSRASDDASALACRLRRERARSFRLQPAAASASRGNNARRARSQKYPIEMPEAHNFSQSSAPTALPACIHPLRRRARLQLGADMDTAAATATDSDSAKDSARHTDTQTHSARRARQREQTSEPPTRVALWARLSQRLVRSECASCWAIRVARVARDIETSRHQLACRAASQAGAVISVASEIADKRDDLHGFCGQPSVCRKPTQGAAERLGVRAAKIVAGSTVVLRPPGL